MSLRSRIERGVALLLLGMAAAAPPPPASPADLAEQLTMLAFDANPGADTPARTVLGRWAGPMRVLVLGRESDDVDAAATARALVRAGVKVEVLPPTPAGRSRPNAFLVVDQNLSEAFRGPLRQLLAHAFLDDDAAVVAFTAAVVDTAGCWTLPVWTDPRRMELQAAVIGVDARQGVAGVQRCIVRGMAAALGLLGPGGFLPDSVFAPQSRITRLSADDERMLRVLYGPAMRPGMTRAQVHQVALRAFTTAMKPAAARPTPEP